MLSNLFPSVVCWAKKVLNRGMPGDIMNAQQNIRSGHVLNLPPSLTPSIYRGKIGTKTELFFFTSQYDL
jgi:hypothetical protein